MNYFLKRLLKYKKIVSIGMNNMPTMIDTPCAYCRNIFTITAGQKKRKFCSVECCRKAQRSRSLVGKLNEHRQYTPEEVAMMARMRS